MEVRLGNIFGFSGGNYAGNVYDKDFLAPTINTMQGGCKQPMIIANINPSGNGINGAVHTVDAEAPTINAEAPTITTNKGEGNKIIVAMRGRNPDNPSDRTVGSPTEQRLEPNSQGICNTLTSVQKDNLVMEVKQLGFMDNGTGQHQSNTVYDEKALCPNITTINGGGTQQIKVFNEPQYRIRKLTPLECWRLMDFTDEDFHRAESVNSNTQLYKQAGNSIVRNVLVAIIGQMISGKEEIYKHI